MPATLILVCIAGICVGWAISQVGILDEVWGMVYRLILENIGLRIEKRRASRRMAAVMRWVRERQAEEWSP
jgi:hypothetical protein